MVPPTGAQTFTQLAHTLLWADHVCSLPPSHCLPLGKLLYGRQKLRQIKKLPTGDATQFGNTGSDISDNRSN